MRVPREFERLSTRSIATLGASRVCLKSTCEPARAFPRKSSIEFFSHMIDALGYLACGAPSVIRGGLQGCPRRWVPVMHRDIKPENTLLASDYSDMGFTIKLADFGVAGRAKKQKEVAGTRQWLPPETPIQGIFTDVWMLGLVILACCNPHLLFNILSNMKPLSAGAVPGYSQALLAMVDFALTLNWRRRPCPIQLAAMWNRSVGS